MAQNHPFVSYNKMPTISYNASEQSIAEVFYHLFDLMLKSTVNSCGHVGTVSYLTTLFLGKPPGGRLVR